MSQVLFSFGSNKTKVWYLNFPLGCFLTASLSKWIFPTFFKARLGSPAASLELWQRCWYSDTLKVTVPWALVEFIFLDKNVMRLYYCFKPSFDWFIDWFLTTQAKITIHTCMCTHRLHLTFPSWPDLILITGVCLCVQLMVRDFLLATLTSTSLCSLVGE